MESGARQRLQIPFKELAIGKRFQMVNFTMKAAVPGSQVFIKVNEIKAKHGDQEYVIRPDWPVETVG